jgi:hypothetical protein
MNDVTVLLSMLMNLAAPLLAILIERCFGMIESSGFVLLDHESMVGVRYARSFFRVCIFHIQNFVASVA